jgi:hypothetical protein
MKTILWFIVSHLVLYVLGSFIAWDLNPLNWWLFTSSFGRVLFVIIELFWIGNSLSD